MGIWNYGLWRLKEAYLNKVEGRGCKKLIEYSYWKVRIKCYQSELRELTSLRLKGICVDGYSSLDTLLGAY